MMIPASTQPWSLRRATHLLGIVLLAALLLSLVRQARLDPAAALPAAAVPTGFTDTVVATISQPIGLAFTPDGRLLITTQSGQLRVMQNDVLVATPALSLGTRVCSDNERGMLGVAVDPSFATNSYIYIYYTFNKFNSCATNATNSPVNRVSRFTLSASNVASGELVLLDNIPSPNSNHNGGDLQFGKDGYLYISVGDGGCQLTNSINCQTQNANARRRDILLGKILRIARDGSVPSDNPWFAEAGSRRCGNPAGVPTGTGACQETWAWGLRNPFRMAFDPNAAGTRFFINDVGNNSWEEIDVGTRGADYGWNIREGFCQPNMTTGCNTTPGAVVNGYTDPIYAYGRETECATITGGAFVPNGAWPATYNGAYLYADYICGKIFALRPNGTGGYTSTEFANGLGGSGGLHLTFGPYNGGQALYYSTYWDVGQIRRISYNAPTPTNTRTATRTNTTGTGPTATRTNTTAPGTCGTANVAQGKPATSSSNENTSLTPNLAVDGSGTTRWASAYSDPQWIRVDLGSTQNICRVQLLWEAAYGRSYSIQTSNDGTTWTSIYATSTGDGGTDNLTGLAGSGRYVRMHGTTRATAWGYSLFEFQIYTGGSATPTRTNTVCACPQTPSPTRTNTTGVATATRTRTNTSVTNPPTATRTRTNTSVTNPPTATRTRTATTSSGTQAWAPGVSYTTGTIVSYGGVNYRCLQSHTSQAGWEPPNVPALWQPV